MNEFTAEITHYALHREVLVVAITRIEGAWVAYCGPVLGLNHKKERGGVLANGARVPESVARALFTEYNDLPYAH